MVMRRREEAAAVATALAVVGDAKSLEELKTLTISNLQARSFSEIVVSGHNSDTDCFLKKQGN